MVVIRLSPLLTLLCATSSPVGSLRNNVTVSFVLNVTSTDSSAPTRVSNPRQYRNFGWQTRLRAQDTLSNHTLVQATTGGVYTYKIFKKIP